MSLDANDILMTRGSDGLRDVFDHALKMNGHDRVDPAPLLSPSVEILPATAFTVEPIRWIWDGW